MVTKHSKNIENAKKLIAFLASDKSQRWYANKNNEIPIINNESSIGAEGYKVIFIHPSYTGGVLLELAEKPV